MLQKPLQKNCLKEALGRNSETYSVKPKLWVILKNWPSLNVGRKAALNFIKFNSRMEYGDFGKDWYIFYSK